MERRKWLEARTQGLGGSDAAAAVGVCPWRSPYQLYLDKVEPDFDRPPTEPMIWGSLLEPSIRQRYSDLTGNEVTVTGAQMVHPDHNWMIANIDGRVNERKIFEAKTSFSAQDWGWNGSDEVPENYNLQVQHYMAVTGADCCDVAVLIGGSDFRILTVYADSELQDLLIERESEFWHNHVLARVVPGIRDADDLKRRYPRSLGNLAQGGPKEIELWKALREVKEQLKALETLKESLEVPLKAKIGSADGLEVEGLTIATWKSAKDSLAFDKDGFAKAHPELYREFLHVVDGSRRFLVKDAK